MRRRFEALLVAFAVGVAMLAMPSEARCDPRTTYLAEQLRTSDDYRVRTQAALALGASDDDAAVKPLCEGLDDSNISVRVAAAAALGKLGRAGGIACLKEAEAKESAPGVKSQIQRSIGALEAAGSAANGSAPPPPPGPDTKYYVALQITNKTSRADDQIEAAVRSAMQSKLLARPGYAVAPKQETLDQGRKVVDGKKVTGYFLIATVEPPIYSGGNLTQVVRVSMWTYPGKSLQGEFAPKLTQSGTREGDTKSEEALVKMCVERAIDTFVKVAASM